jgi:hypothetical protein
MSSELVKNNKSKQDQLFYGKYGIKKYSIKSKINYCENGKRDKY